MTGEEREWEVRRIVGEVYGIDPAALRPETDFYAHLDDSIQAAEVARVRTLGDLLALVKAQGVGGA